MPAFRWLASWSRLCPRRCTSRSRGWRVRCAAAVRSCSAIGKHRGSEGRPPHRASNRRPASSGARRHSTSPSGGSSRERRYFAHHTARKPAIRAFASRCSVDKHNPWLICSQGHYGGASTRGRMMSQSLAPNKPFAAPVVDQLSVRVVVDSRCERFLPKMTHPFTTSRTISHMRSQPRKL
jgi:hypothetical protein